MPTTDLNNIDVCSTGTVTATNHTNLNEFFIATPGPIQNFSLDHAGIITYDYATTFAAYRAAVVNGTLTIANDCNKGDILYYVDGILNSFTQNPKKEANMETLFKIYVVSKDRKMVHQDLVVAKDEEEAKLVSDISDALKRSNLKPRDVTILCHEIGDVRVREEVKKVQVVDEQK